MDEENQNEDESILIRAKIVYGLNTNVIGNIHFNANGQEIIYPIEGVIAFHNYDTNQQRFLRFPENVALQYIIISPNRKYLGVLERLVNVTQNNEPVYVHSICIYDVITLKKLRTVEVDETISKHADVAVISFTSDSSAMVVLSKPPNEKLFLHLFNSENTVIKGYPLLNNKNGSVECIACNPKQSHTIAVGGKNLFRIMKENEKGFLSNEDNLDSKRYHIKSVVWISGDILIGGTNDGMILFVEDDEIKIKYNALETNVYDLSMDFEEQEFSNELLIGDEIENRDYEKVLCMTSFGNGFVYSIFNSVYVFEIVSRLKSVRKTIIRIELGSFAKELCQITNVAINPTQDKIICTTKYAQIYISDLFPPETSKTVVLEFSPLGENLHTDEIVALSICSWRPIVMTASKDQTVRIWNYETAKLELLKRYQVDITMAELHPVGVLAAVGFWSQIRIMKIHIDDLIIAKTYNFPDCNDVKFSNFGHFLAVAYKNLIAIISVFNFEILKNLKGHFANVLSITWSKDDKYLASGGADGAVYLWDINTGERIQEFVNKGIQYPAVIMKQDSTIYALTNFGTLREIFDSNLKQEIKLLTTSPSTIPPPEDVDNDSFLISMSLSRSEKNLFISSKFGHIFNLQLPFREIAEQRKIHNYRYFTNAVTKTVITYDDLYLIIASNVGTLAICQILSNDYDKPECSTILIDQDLLKTTEILIPRQQLFDKIETIKYLEHRIKEQNIEFRRQLNENEITTMNEIKEIENYYEQIVKDNKMKMEQLNYDKLNELQLKNMEIAQTKNKCNEKLRNIIDEYEKEISKEEDKINELKENQNNLNKTYNEKLNLSKNCLQETIQAIENEFKLQIDEYRKCISDLKNELDESNEEHQKLYHEIETDNDVKLIELQKMYQENLKKEQNEMKNLMEEYDRIKEKYDRITEEQENLCEEMKLLKTREHQYETDIEEYKMKIRKIEDNELQLLTARCSELENIILEKDHSILMKEKQIQQIKEMHERNLEKSLSNETRTMNLFPSNSKKIQKSRLKKSNSKRQQQQMMMKINNEFDNTNSCSGTIQDDDDDDNKKQKLIARHNDSTLVSKSNSAKKTEITDQLLYFTNEAFRKRILMLENHLSYIYGDIHKLLQISSTNNLKIVKNYIRKLHETYIKDKDLKQIMETNENDQISNEYIRQKNYLENKIAILQSQKNSDNRIYEDVINRLIKDKSILIRELNKLKKK